jgi:hypothetical protein
VTNDIYEEKARQKENRMTFGLCHIRLLSHQIRVPLGRHVLQYIVQHFYFLLFTPSIDRRPANQFQFGQEQLLLIFFLHRHHHRRKRRRTKMTLTVCVGASGSGKSMHAKLANKGISFGLFRQKQLALSALRLTPSLTHTIVKQRYLLFCYTSLTFFLTPSISYNNYRQNYLPQRCAQIS